MREVFWIAAFGAAGAVGRYAVNLGAARLQGGQFPLATLLVNVAGCFLIGLVMSVGQETKLLSPLLVTAASVGFLGAFTTYSAFAFQTSQLLRSEQYLAASVNILANLILGILAVWGGLVLTRWVFRTS